MALEPEEDLTRAAELTELAQHEPDGVGDPLVRVDRQRPGKGTADFGWGRALGEDFRGRAASRLGLLAGRVGGQKPPAAGSGSPKGPVREPAAVG